MQEKACPHDLRLAHLVGALCNRPFPGVLQLTKAPVGYRGWGLMVRHTLASAQSALWELQLMIQGCPETYMGIVPGAPTSTHGHPNLQIYKIYKTHFLTHSCFLSMATESECEAHC